jgi:hypothetical protein
LDQVICSASKFNVLHRLAEASVVKLDWSDPTNPKLLAIKDTVGSAAAKAIANGHVYGVAYGTGGNRFPFGLGDNLGT